MSSASPVSSCQPGTPRAAHRQPDFETPGGAKTTRILPWKSINLPPIPSTTANHPWWLWPNLLSLDAPLIAVLWLQLLALSARVHVSPFATLALALVVWMIYVADRLLDGLRGRPSASLSARHQFYQQHRNFWVSLLLAVLALVCCVCFELDHRTLELGALLMLVVAGYFGFVHWICLRWRLRFPKEAVVAVVFGVGTFFPVWIYAHRSAVAMTITLVLFIAICWLNTTLIEYVEWMSARQCSSEMPHMLTLAAGRHLLPIAAAVAVAAFILAQLRTTSAVHSVLLASSLSALALAGLGFCWPKFSLNMVRVLADTALLTPCALLLFLHR